MIDPLYIWLTPYLAAGIMAITWVMGIRKESFYSWLSVLSILVSAIIATILTPKVYHGDIIYTVHSWMPDIGVNVGTYMDGLGAFMSLVVAWLSFLIAVYSTKYMEGDWGFQRYFFFFTFFVGSMLLLVLADNLVLLFIGWEGTGLASYALIGHWYTDDEDTWVGDPGRKALGTNMYFEPSHSGVRAILFTKIGDIGMLIGMAGIFALTGTLSIPQISNLASQSDGWMATLANMKILTAFLVVFSLGALAKSAQFPFQEWLVTAMTGPTPVSALIHAATMVKAGVYFMLRFAPIFAVGAANLGGAVLDAVTSYFWIIALLGGITAFMMATMAIVSRELKLILAFSTASQLGYMFLGVGAAGYLLKGAEAGTSNTLSLVYEGIAASASHLMSHAVFKAALFLIAGWAIHAVHSRFIDDMGNFAKYMKISMISMWLAGLSLAGIPPFSGFWSKEGVLHTAHLAGLENLWLLGVITAGITAFYITRATVRVFHIKPYHRHEEEHHLHEAPLTMLLPYFILALTALVIGLAWPLGFSEKVAELLGHTLAMPSAELPSVEFTGITLEIVGYALLMVLFAIVLYLAFKPDFVGLLQKSTTARILHDFLYDRWYINALIYIFIVGGFAGLVEIMGWINGVIDAFYHVAIPVVLIAGSQAFRGLHRGRTDLYLTFYAYFIGVALLVLYFLWG
ncbi:MAG: NADH-quinone oxidoreductase subunit L [Desulfurococcales archaeon]|nr:NADH-quinone oxidoreductase subunit L [Desulfurococcales archaeon]